MREEAWGAAKRCAAEGWRVSELGEVFLTSGDGGGGGDCKAGWEKAASHEGSKKRKQKASWGREGRAKSKMEEAERWEQRLELGRGDGRKLGEWVSARLREGKVKEVGV